MRDKDGCEVVTDYNLETECCKIRMQMNVMDMLVACHVMLMNTFCFECCNAGRIISCVEGKNNHPLEESSYFYLLCVLWINYWSIGRFVWSSYYSCDVDGSLRLKQSNRFSSAEEKALVPKEGNQSCMHLHFSTFQKHWRKLQANLSTDFCVSFFFFHCFSTSLGQLISSLEKCRLEHAEWNGRSRLSYDGN